MKPLLLTLILSSLTASAFAGWGDVYSCTTSTVQKVFLDGIFSYSPATIIGIFAPNERGKNDNKVGSSLLCIDIIFLLSSYFYFGIAQGAHF